jgi:hypothetical protein
MDVCSHIIEGMQGDAMALLDEVLPAGVSRKITPISPKTGGVFKHLATSRGGGTGRRSGLKIAAYASDKPVDR